MALILSLESHHGKKFDRNRPVKLISAGTVKCFFPASVAPLRSGA
jgi:hypothetical protein